MNIVSLRKCGAYTRNDVSDAVTSLIDDIGGKDYFFKKGQQVLLKPNLLKDDPKNKGIITHPEVTRAVAQLAVECGCKVKIGDSPGWGKVGQVYEKSGFKGFFKDLPVEIVNFDKPVEIKNPNGIYKRFYVDKNLLDADVIVNLPKLKTHGQMLVTFALKNTFGAVVGKAKPQWHLNAGRKYSDFAKMIVELHYLIKPSINLIDGIMAMENEGPAAGDPVRLGFLGASPDARALDTAICRILKIDTERVFVLQAAKELNLGIEEDKLIFKGDLPFETRIDGFKLPTTVSLETLGIASFMGGFLKDALTVKPSIIQGKCTLCESCIKQCPAGVMSVKKSRFLKGNFVNIDYRNCIRCFCCQEICPEEAIKLKQGWIINFYKAFKSDS